MASWCPRLRPRSTLRSATKHLNDRLGCPVRQVLSIFPGAALCLTSIDEESEINEQ